MSDILAQLKALGVTKGIPEVLKPAVKKPTEQIDALLKTFPNGIVVENDCGYAFINRLKQPVSQLHGIVDMSAALQNDPLFDSIMELQILRKEDTLAFDTETSGLSNGSGSFIFMNGLGYFEDDSYIVDQLILPDISAETAFLRQTELIFNRFPVLLSYNGKGFDIPMLQSRLHFHMFPDFTKEIKHCDLLKLTRRYWKQALGSVPLSNIEHYILKLQRGDEEVPGYLAPELYRDFLRDGDAGHIAGVAYHNQIDVVSLSALLLYINGLVLLAGKDPGLWKENRVSETALLRFNLPFFSGEHIGSSEDLSDRDKKAMVSGLFKAGETEKALSILKELAAKGDHGSAEKLMKYYLKTGNAELFEQFRKLTIELIQNDETYGKWSRAEKTEKIMKIRFKEK